MDASAKALEEKNNGNAAMSAGDFQKAVECYTRAIELDPNNYVLYSNRSAAYASLEKYAEALTDADQTISLKPDWGKGYSRKGTALCYLNKFSEAREAYQEGLAKEPGNELLLKGLDEVEARQRERAERSIGGMFAQLFGPDMWAKLKLNPSTNKYLDDPAFVSLLNSFQRDPSTIQRHLQDPRVANVLGVLMGIGTPGADQGEPMEEEKEEPRREEKKEEKKPETKKVEEPSTADLNLEQQQALEEKNKGNEAYKKKNFEEAIEHYTKAMELDPTSMVYQTNIAAVYFEMGKYEDCIKHCRDAIDTGRANKADYRIIAKAFARIGNACMKLQDYSEAVNAYSSSLTEYRTKETLKALKQAEALKKEKEDREYLSEEKSKEEKDKGNEAFRNGDIPNAIHHYTEAIRRNPTDHTLYSNRAACYTKLGEYPLGLKDCDKCIELDPTFVKGYTRKGHIQFFMKQYHKCLETYDQGLKLDPENEELVEGIKRTIAAINERQSGEADEASVQQAMSDPEIQGILRDPMMRKVLSDLQSDPRAAQNYLNDPTIMNKINKLVAAGVIRTK
ncbi:Hsp70-Hsp90 organizing protein 3-like [Balamuthia mandrillaris]